VLVKLADPVVMIGLLSASSTTNTPAHEAKVQDGQAMSIEEKIEQDRKVNYKILEESPANHPVVDSQSVKDEIGRTGRLPGLLRAMSVRSTVAKQVQLVAHKHSPQAK
jgi:hypothetical protein